MPTKGLKRAAAFLDGWLQYRYKRLDIPGFVVAIASKGDIVFKKAYGFADLERSVKMTTNHIFRVASHSKTFSATAVMQLAEQKKLSIDEPICNYLEWLKVHKDPRMNRVTTRQLLSHSAGVIRDGLDCNYWQMIDGFPDEGVFIEEMKKADLVLDSNLKMKYSNFGYTLIGCLIETISGVSYHEYVDKNIISKLGLKATGPEFEEKIMASLVTGYTRKEDGRRLPCDKRSNTRAMAAATGFFSTASDLIKYFNAQMVGSGKLLSDESKKEMQRTQWRVMDIPDFEEYGLGLEISYSNDRRLFGHGGGFPGQITKTFCDPDNGLIVVVLTNCIDGDARTIARGILSVIDHFERSDQCCDAATLGQLRPFQGIFRGLWGDLGIVENGPHLAAVNPDVWSPFGADQSVQILERIDDSTLKVARAGGFDNPGELVHYEFDEHDNVKALRYGGSHMWPDEEYRQYLSKTFDKQSLVSG